MTSEVDGEHRRQRRHGGASGWRIATWAVVALIVLVPLGLGVLMLSSEPPPNDQLVPSFAEVDRPVFGGLAEESERAAVIAIASSGERATLLRDESHGWIVQERDGYPATAGLVTDLLTELASMRAIYVAAGLPATLAGQTVTDEALAPGTAVQVSVADETGEPLLETVIGDTLPTPGGDQLTSVVLKPGDGSEIVIADSAIRPTSAPSEWLDRLVVHIPVERVRLAEVAPVGSESPLVIRWNQPTPGAFTAEGVSAEAEMAEGQWTYRWIASGLEDLRFEDVRSADAIPEFEAAILSEAIYRTIDGLQVRAWLAQHEGEHWLRLQAEVVEPLPLEDDPVTSQTVLPPEQVEAEAETINRRVGPWTYKVPDLTVDKLQRNPMKLLN